MYKQLAKVATQWNSGATRDSNPGPRVRVPSALTTTPLSHTKVKLCFTQLFFPLLATKWYAAIKTKKTIHPSSSAVSM